MNANQIVFMCYHCQNYQTRVFRRLIEHLRLVHAHEPNFSIRCGINNCEKVYNNVDSYVKHIKRNHGGYRLDNDGPLENNNVDVHRCEELDDNLAGGDINDNPVAHIGQNRQLEDDNPLENGNLQNAVGLFILKMKEKHSLPKTTVNKLLQDLHALLACAQSHQSEQVKAALLNEGLDVDRINAILEMSERNSPLSVLDYFGSEANQQHFVLNNTNHVAPVEYILGECDDGTATYMYVPILESLKSLLKSDDVRTEVLNTHQYCQNGVLQNFCDGTLYQNNAIFQMKSSLQIQLFFDDFEVCNPIGSYSKKQKLNGMYFTIGNLAAKYRSKLSSIQLVWLCKTTILKKFGLKVLAKQLINDLKTLETDGISIDSHGENYKFRGTVSSVVADNLGSHGIGGFMEGFTANRICRTCMCTYASLKQPYLSTNYRERTVDGHEHQLQMIRQHPNLSSVYGVKSDSPLNELSFFDVINGLPFDPMHDLLEGVCPLVWSKVLTSLVESKHLSILQMNSKLQHFQYTGTDKSSKPSQLSWSSRKVVIRQNASQMWCFCRLAPMMFGGNVPADSDIWELVLQLNDILNLVFAPKQNFQMIAYLHGIIEDFLKCYLQLFPDNGLVPKMHYLTHYSKQMEQYGPLINCTTTRFEAKHSYFKDLARKTKNRKNLAKTLALRHQSLMSLHSISGNVLGEDNIKSTGLKEKHVETFCPIVRNILSQTLESDKFQVASSVTIHGTLYRSNFVVASHIIEDVVYFAKISLILLHNSEAYFLLQNYTDCTFCRKYHCYVASEVVSDPFLVKWSDILDFHPLSIGYNDGMQHIVQRYRYLEEFP